MEHYSDCFYADLTRGTLSEENLQAKEAYHRLAATHRARVCTYIADNGRFTYHLFKEAFIDLWKTDKILQGEISPQKYNC